MKVTTILIVLVGIVCALLSVAGGLLIADNIYDSGDYSDNFFRKIDTKEVFINEDNTQCKIIDLDGNTILIGEE